MNILDNSDWSSIEDEIIKHIPYIPSNSEQYNEWLSIVWSMKYAGIDKSKVDTWCQEGEIPESKWKSFKYKDINEARNFLISKAEKHGFILHNKIQFNDKYDADLTQKLLNLLFDSEDNICWTQPRWDDDKKKFVPDGTKVKFWKRSRFTADEIERLTELFHNGCYIQLNKVNQNKFQDHIIEHPKGSVMDEHIETFKYYFVEFDKYTIEEQKEILNKIYLPWVGIVHSGNKSLHVYLRLDASNLEEFKDHISKIHKYLDNKGINYDHANKNPGRFCRGFWSHRLGKDETNGEKEQFVMSVNDNPISFNKWFESVGKTSLSQEDKIKEAVKKLFFNDVKKDKKGKIVKDENGNEIQEEKFAECNFVSFIECLGFRQLIDDNGNNEYIRITDNYFIESMTKNSIKIILYNECKRLMDKKHYDIIYNSGVIEKDKTINSIKIIKLVEHLDNSDSIFLYFNNEIIEVKKDGVRKLDYKFLNGFLRKNAFKSIKRNFTYTDEIGDFEKFCKNIVSNDNERFKVLQSIFGYYISRFRRQSMCKCVILTDRIEDGTLSKGGTGKSTLVEALREVRSVGTLNGKQKNLEQRFMFCGYQEGNTIYAHDDILESFDTELMFPAITGKTIVEKKGKDSIEVFLKHIITSNYVPKNIVSDDSHKRRFNVFELDHFYSVDHTPYNEFGKDFFSEEWTEKDWNQFYSFMIRCCKVFLVKGILSYATENAEYVKLLNSVNRTALEFVQKIASQKYQFDGKDEISIKDIKDDYSKWVDSLPNGNELKKYAKSAHRLTSELEIIFGAGYTKKHNKTGGDSIYLDASKTILLNETITSSVFETKEDDIENESVVTFIEDAPDYSKQDENTIFYNIFPEDIEKDPDGENMYFARISELGGAGIPCTEDGTSLEKGVELNVIRHFKK